MSLMILILSLLMGLSFIVGLLINKTIKRKWITYFATSLAFVIIISVLVTDIIPEIIESSYNYTSIWLAIIGELFGIFLLIIMDLLVPHHHHEHKHNDDNKNDHKEHLYHIGMLTFVSVIMHNVLEGIAFYLVGKASIKAALLMAGGIALHNIPLGIEISSFFGKTKKKDIIKPLLLTISGTIGAFIGLLVGDLSSTVNIIVLSITCGMMLYLGFFELGIETFNERKEKGIIEGILVGAIIFALLLW